MERVAIIGSAGAGKSVLARKLGAITGLPVIHLDALFWHPGWVETPRPEWRTIQEGLVEGPRWVVDGNYGSTMDIRLAAADTVIFLDLPRALCLWRTLRRSFSPLGKDRPDMASGCPERLDLEYLKFLRWIWRFPRDERPAILEKLGRLEALAAGEAGARPVRVIRLRSAHEVEAFVSRVAAHTRRGG